MEMLEVTPIKTLAKSIDSESCQVLQFIALSNGQFDVDIYDVYMYFGEDYTDAGWSCNEDEPEYTRRFNDFLSANKHLDELSVDYIQTPSHDPLDAIEEMFELEYEKEQKERSTIRESMRIKEAEENRKKQEEFEKTNRFEATCKMTGNRSIFTAETKEKALKMAELYFSGEILRIEKTNLKVTTKVYGGSSYESEIYDETEQEQILIEMGKQNDGDMEEELHMMDERDTW